MRFYLDESVSERVTDSLAALGFDATSADRLGHKGRRDTEQMIIAARLHRVLVTYDTNDFILLHDAWRSWPSDWGLKDEPRHAGVLVIYPSKGIRAVEIAGLISQLVTTNPDLTNRLFGWSSRRGWEEGL